MNSEVFNRITQFLHSFPPSNFTNHCCLTFVSMSLYYFLIQIGNCILDRTGLLIRDIPSVFSQYPDFLDSFRIPIPGLPGGAWLLGKSENESLHYHLIASKHQPWLKETLFWVFLYKTHTHTQTCKVNRSFSIKLSRATVPKATTDAEEKVCF